MFDNGNVSVFAVNNVVLQVLENVTIVFFNGKYCSAQWWMLYVLDSATLGVMVVNIVTFNGGCCMFLTMLLFAGEHWCLVETVCQGKFSF